MSISLQWYALRSKPNKEEALWREVAARGVEVFYPRMQVQPKNPRARKLRPYFPGYLFVQLDLEQSGYSLFAWMPHSLGLVSFGSEPAPVQDALIQTLKKKLGEINAAGGELLHDLKQGDAVEIQSGPFAGYEAIFDARLAGSERVRVLLKLLEGRFTKMEVPTGLLERSERSRKS